MPASDGPLVTGPGTPSTPTGGERITVSGKGYAPGSAIDLYIFSTPRRLGSATTDASGAFTATVTLPAGLAAGTHHLVGAGLDPSGDPRYTVLAVTLAGSRQDGGADLAPAGFGSAPYLGAGSLALVVGAGLVVMSRRRRTS
ncbi:MAG: hypothetical protein M3Q47_11135 [Actinomycetota bacterium]|nr:hypothetical protein [Actinomycetota bacterium]